MRKLYTLIASLVVSTILVSPVFALTPYLASGLLGQYNAGAADYSSTLTNGFDGPSTNAVGFDTPTDIEVDETNNRLFISDQGNNRVLVHQLNVNNQIVDETADHVLGQADFTSSASGTSQTAFDQPAGLAYDSQRDLLFVADSNNNRVLVFDTTSITNGEAAVHVIGQNDFTSSTSATTQNTLSGPWSIDYDEVNQWLIVNDNFNYRILAYDVSVISNGMNASYVIGADDFVTAPCCNTLQPNRFFFLQDILVDENSRLLYATDSFNDRILVFDLASISNGMNASYVLGADDFTTAGKTITPEQDSTFGAWGLAINSSDSLLYISDNDSRILVFDVSTITNGEAAMGVLGKASYTDDTFPAASQTAVSPYEKLVYSQDANILYAASDTNMRVMAFEFPNITTTSLASATLSQPYNTTITSSGTQGTTSFSVSSGSLPQGLSLSVGGAISGTPTQLGTYNFTVTVTDNNGVAGTYSDSQSYSLVVGEPDADNDGISDAVENAGPNGGDANGDGTADSSQPGVATTTNPVTSGYTTVESSSGTVANYSVQDEANLPTQNNDADFPVGLNSFNITGLANGATETVTVYFDQQYDTSSWVYMKYDSYDSSYTDMSSIVTYNTAVVGGQTVTTATYALTDGGPYDEDGIANGTIVDPAGPAVLELADTGSSPIYPIIAAALILISAHVLQHASQITYSYKQ